MSRASSHFASRLFLGSTCASRAGERALALPNFSWCLPCRQGFAARKDCCGGAPQPAREARALPRIIRAVLLAAVLCVSGFAAAGEANLASKSYVIDLPTTLRLAGARNLDIEIARQQLAEAKASQESAIERFFPSLSPGATYRRHDNLIQNTEGVIEEVHKQSYAPGATVTAQTEFGDALFKSLEARQLVKAAGHALDAQRQDTIAAAAQAYWDLSRDKAAVGVAREAVATETSYASEIERAVGIGLAFRGDALRVKVQRQRGEVAVRKAEEFAAVAGARLAQILHLDPAVQLTARDTRPLPMSFVSASAPVETLIDEAIAARPELKRSAATVAASREARRGAIYGPLIPAVGGQAFIGGLGGGKNSETGNFGESEDYAATLSWRIGPGGLFDFGRIHLQDARLRTSALAAEKVRDQIAREVVESRARVLSLQQQLEAGQQSLSDAQEVLRLGQERKEFGIGVVLEMILAQQELSRVRNDYLNIVTDYNKTQYALLRALGRIAVPKTSRRPGPPP